MGLPRHSLPPLARAVSRTFQPPPNSAASTAASASHLFRRHLHTTSPLSDSRTRPSLGPRSQRWHKPGSRAHLSRPPAGLRLLSSSLACASQNGLPASGSASAPPSSPPAPTPAVKQPRSTSGTSLRRVAVEAERSLAGGYLRQRGSHQFVDPDVVTKKVTGYCAAERYNIPEVSRLVRHDGFSVDPFKTGLYPQVVHIQTPVYPPELHGPAERGMTEPGDVFIFPSGTVVAWNVPERVCARLVEVVLAPAAENGQVVEQDSLDYLEDPTKDASSVVGDTIVLGTHDPAAEGDDRVGAAEGDSNTVPPQLHDQARPTVAPHQPLNTLLTKIAFSSGLARSTKLQVLESLLDRYFDSTRSIPSILSRGQRLPFGRRSILRKTGELLQIRAQLNLYSELTDSLPDLFWDARHSLGLEDYFDNIGKALDVGVRIKLLNQRMDYAQEMATVLREQLSEKHGLRLEWGIIFLILVEVLFECRALWKEYRSTSNPDHLSSSTLHSP